MDFYCLFGFSQEDSSQVSVKKHFQPPSAKVAGSRFHFLFFSFSNSTSNGCAILLQPSQQLSIIHLSFSQRSSRRLPDPTSRKRHPACFPPSFSSAETEPIQRLLHPAGGRPSSRLYFHLTFSQPRKSRMRLLLSDPRANSAPTGIPLHPFTVTDSANTRDH